MGALEWGREWIAFDRGFTRFRTVKWQCLPGRKAERQSMPNMARRQPQPPLFGTILVEKPDVLFYGFTVCNEQWRKRADE
jgi:hypothetical protein